MVYQFAKKKKIVAVTLIYNPRKIILLVQLSYTSISPPKFIYFLIFVHNIFTLREFGLELDNYKKIQCVLKAGISTLYKTETIGWLDNA